jgi:hypothetical protein
MPRTFVAAAFLLIFSCATGSTFNVSVSSLADVQRAAGKSYILLPSAEGVGASDLQFREFAGYVAGALERQGFTPASNFGNADVAIFLAYGIGDPAQQTYSYSIPVYGQTGGGTTTINLSTFGAGGWTSTSGTITTSPTHRQVGSQTVTQTSVTYFRYLILDAVDLKTFRETEKVMPVWRTNVTSTGRSGDLRLVVPILVAASEPHIGVSTGKQVHVQLTEGDARVQRVRLGRHR